MACDCRATHGALVCPICGSVDGSRLRASQPRSEGGFGPPPGGHQPPPGGGDFGAPPPGGGGGGVGPDPLGRNEAAQQLLPPAIALMIYGGLGALLQVVGLIANIAGAGMGAMSGGDMPMAEMLGGAVGIVFNVISLLAGGFVIFAGLKMKDLQNHTLAMAAAILCMVPCINPCCFLVGLGPGIWALVMLLKPEIKAAFQS